MERSSGPSEVLDLERDLVTTSADVEALRRHRPEPAGSLVDIGRLVPPALGDRSGRRRTTFPPAPPFELEAADPSAE